MLKLRQIIKRGKILEFLLIKELRKIFHDRSNYR